MCNKSKKKTIWRCSSYVKNCRSRLFTQDDKVVIQVGHNHPPPREEINASTPFRFVKITKMKKQHNF